MEMDGWRTGPGWRAGSLFGDGRVIQTPSKAPNQVVPKNLTSHNNGQKPNQTKPTPNKNKKQQKTPKKGANTGYHREQRPGRGAGLQYERAPEDHTAA